MSFRDTIFATTGAFGWIIIALGVVALLFVITGYIRKAHAIARNEGWRVLWQHIRRHVLTRPPRNRL